MHVTLNSSFITEVARSQSSKPTGPFWLPTSSQQRTCGSIGTLPKKVCQPCSQQWANDLGLFWKGGLLGSQAVAKDFQSRGVPIRAQIQFDMTGMLIQTPDSRNLTVICLAWVKKGTREEVGIITDFVDTEYVFLSCDRSGN